MMNTDKAYLLGLVIGGGIFGNAEDTFRIRLPFRKWGSYLENPHRASQISRDIMSVVSPMFRNTYGVIVSFDASESVWYILCDGDTSELKTDLMKYGISSDGEILASANINKVCNDLVDNNLKRRFIAGLADTIGSMAKSQRRFTDEHQILSFEIKGYNFNFVCDLCRLLYSVNCIPDQVNWNHPNIHCASDPYYSQWNKGFKLRILLDQYARFGAFAFRTKAESSNENRCLQQNTHIAVPCPKRDIHITPSSVHPAEKDMRLPELIRGGHYIHFRHFCTVMGCEHAPYEKICSQFSKIGELINPFPILCKNTYTKIKKIISNNSLMLRRNYEVKNVSVASLASQVQSGVKYFYGNKENNGYPILEVMQAVAYIIANDNELFGKRPRGNYVETINRHIESNPGLTVEIRKPDLLTPLVIVGNGRGALVGADNPDVYKKLVSRSPENEYKLYVRQITEEDLQNV